MNHINKTAIITGSAKGLGREIAIALGKNGCNVVVHYNTSKKQAEMVKSIIEKSGSKAITAITIKADLTNPDEVKRLFAETHKQFGRIDFLINNVGNFIFKDISKIEYPEWKHILDTTLNSTFLCCKECLHYMRKQKFGRIINIGDSEADKIHASKMMLPYKIGKTGVLMLTKSLAVSEAKNNITVNIVSPGIMPNSVVKPSLNKIPLGRYAEFEDVVNAVLFLLGEKANYITGENLNVASGWGLQNGTI